MSQAAEAAGRSEQMRMGWLWRMAMQRESGEEAWELEAATAGDGGGCRPPPWRRRLGRATRGEESQRARAASLVGRYAGWQVGR